MFPETSAFFTCGRMLLESGAIVATKLLVRDWSKSIGGGGGGGGGGGAGGGPEHLEMWLIKNT